VKRNGIKFLGTSFSDFCIVACVQADEKLERFQQAQYRDANAAEGVITTSLNN